MALRNVTFLCSAKEKSGWIDDDIPEIVLLGRSNVGKSTFINRMCNQRQLARVSSEPGRTQLLNFFLVDGRYRLVDAPGYGYSKVSIHEDAGFESMMMDYLLHRKNLIAAIVLIDARRIPSEEDQWIIQWLKIHHLPFFLITTKSDKLTQKEKAQLEKSIIDLNLPHSVNIIKSSLKEQEWIEEVSLKFDELVLKKALAKKR